MARVDYNAIADRYDAGRAAPLDALGPWRSAVEPHVPAAGVVLDVGSGTGIFAEAFARWFGVRVIGVEPSAGMRAQFSDLDRCACEIGRALTLNGTVLIRSAFPGRLDHIRLFDYFPMAREVAETFPTVAATAAAFAAAGFVVVALERVEQQWAPSLRAYAGRVRLRTDSTLAPLTDAEFRAGLRKLDLDAAREHQPSPVVDGLDLLVLTREV